jgi:CubicO group peptidase (beta-lactamase class C family)
MTDLNSLLQTYVSDGTLPGAVALVARGSSVEVAAVGSLDASGSAPMTRDSIFRIASITKPIAAAAVMLLVEDGKLTLDSPIDEWLPELAAPSVVRTPSSELSDVVPAARPITVFDLLTSRAGYGFPDEFTMPSIQELFTIQGDGRIPQNPPAPDEWMAALSKIPLASQPGSEWLYNTCSDLQGVLVARVSGQSFPDFLASRVFAPLGMTDSGFVVPESKRSRFTSYYRRGENGLDLEDGPDGGWSTLPPFPSGAGGLVATVDDWFAFARMLLANGDGFLTPESVRLMTTNHLTAAQRESSKLFLEGQGWGFGGAVDTDVIDPWNVIGRYGWVGGTGTSAYITPSTGTIGILLTQLGTEGPVTPQWMRDFWHYTATP